MIPPDTSLNAVDWIPPKRLPNLRKLGLRTVADLALHYPRRHEDRRHFSPFPDQAGDQPVLLCGTVVKAGYLPYGGWRRGFQAVLEEIGVGPLARRITCRWFNMPYVGKLIATGLHMVAYGRPKARGKQLLLDFPEFEMIEDDGDTLIHLNRIVPVHPAGEGITPRRLREWIFQALQAADLAQIPSLLPGVAHAPARVAALRAIHFPESFGQLEEARRLLVREEFFAMQALIVSRRARVEALPGKTKEAPGKLLEHLLAALPFALTAAQKRAIVAIRADMASDRRMNRLLQGDVGSGKTLVALAAALLAIESGYQAAIMAPTQLLAEQHYTNFQRLLAPLGLRVALRTGAKRQDNAPLPLFENAAITSGSIGFQPVPAGILPADLADQVRYARRNLPHFERPWAKYGITFGTHKKRPLAPAARRIVLDAILHEKRRNRFELYAVCVMPDHVHLLIEPSLEPNAGEKPVFYALPLILHSIKSFTATRINQIEKSTEPVWEPESFDRIIRSEKDLQEKFRYITRNPWDAGIVSPEEDYPFVWWPEKNPGSMGFQPVQAGILPADSSRQDAGSHGLEAHAPRTDIPQLLVGTHALLHDPEELQNPGLIVIDEQHKFGVMQRAKLILRADAPDVLVMTATPIPRTLAQTAYGDLDVTVIDEMPADRGKIITGIRDAKKLPEAAAFLRRQIEAGRQVYIVYPLVEESEKLEAKAATAEFEKWRELLAPHACGLLHGRLKPEEKDTAMRAFVAGETKALVATTVIEVGIDVPNATVMLVENADRFGLAQLHQLRGRIGRGTHTSYCILMPGEDTPEAREKLAVLEQTRDGFVVAEADLRLRGPGDLLGTAQTGLPPLRLGDLLRDAAVLDEARRQATAIFRADPTLAHPEHAPLKNWLQRQDATALEG